jgi:hypothetical protein
MDWADQRLDLRKWKRVRGNPFADYDPADGIALWSLWEMPSLSVGKFIRRGRPKGIPTSVRSVRLPVAEWQRLEREAKKKKISVNALIATCVSRAS